LETDDAKSGRWLKNLTGTFTDSLTVYNFNLCTEVNIIAPPPQKKERKRERKGGRRKRK
jgi:hypothetical protein